MTMFMSWSESVTATITVVTVAVFVFLGVRVRIFAAGSYKQRPHDRNIFRALAKNFRYWQLQYFQHIAAEMISDTNNMIEQNKTPMETRAMTPLVADARKKGEQLLTTQRFYHLYFSRNERNLKDTVTRLTILERRLKSLPRSSLSLDDILAGRFSSENFLGQGVQII